MTSVSVGTAAVNVTDIVARGKPIIQNLGPGNVYFDSQPGVTAASGVKLVVGATYEFAEMLGDETGLSLIADAANTDVRIIVMGV